MVRQGCISSGRWGESVPFAVSRGHLHSLLMAPSSVFKTDSAASLRPSQILAITLCPCGYSRILSPLKILNCITFSECLLPCKVLRMRMWTSLGGHYSVHPTPLCVRKTTGLPLSSLYHFILQLIDFCICFTP